VKQLLHILKTEKQFRKLFRAFLIPGGIFCFFVCFIPGIAAFYGKNTVFVNEHPVTGWPALVDSILIWPFATLMFSTIWAGIFFVLRKISPTNGTLLFGRK
jgi:TRAP-type C4-dicarboxylate transport system permease small subunit